MKRHLNLSSLQTTGGPVTQPTHSGKDGDLSANLVIFADLTNTTVGALGLFLLL